MDKYIVNKKLSPEITHEAFEMAKFIGPYLAVANSVDENLLYSMGIYWHMVECRIVKVIDFIIDNDIFENFNRFEEYDAYGLVGEFVEKFFKANDLAFDHSTNVRHRRYWIKLTEDIVNRYIGMYLAFIYHKYRYHAAADDRPTEQALFEATWFKLSAYNKENNILIDFDRDFLMEHIPNWVEQYILPKRPDLFAQLDIARGRSEVAVKVNIPLEKVTTRVPDFENVEGYVPSSEIDDFLNSL